MNLSINKGGLQEYPPVDKGAWIHLVNNAQSPWAYSAILGDVGARSRRVASISPPCHSELGGKVGVVRRLGSPTAV